MGRREQALEAALRKILAVTDRKHNFWDEAKAALALPVEPAGGDEYRRGVEDAARHLDERVAYERAHGTRTPWLDYIEREARQIRALSRAPATPAKEDVRPPGRIDRMDGFGMCAAPAKEPARCERCQGEGTVGIGYWPCPACGGTGRS